MTEKITPQEESQTSDDNPTAMIQTPKQKTLQTLSPKKAPDSSPRVLKIKEKN